MTFEEYQVGGHGRFAALVEAIQHIINAAVVAQGMHPYAITGRAKTPESLAKKLTDRGIDPASAIDEQIKDLGGVRIVFLTNGEVDAFTQAGVLHDNFDILEVNVHHPVPGTESETRLFDSTNYLVQLKPERLALPEYKLFEGLRAEIQVQTLLNHAWAEMGHDRIYKQPKLKHLGEKRLAAIRERLDQVMREHLLPAGHDFDKIAREFDQLLEADQSVDSAMETLTKSSDNDELGGAISALSDFVLPRFDEPCAQFLRLVTILIDAVERTRGSPSGTIKMSFGSFPGKSGEDIALKISRLILSYRYCDPAQTFTTLVRLYSGARTDSERKIWVDLGTEFSGHNLDVWKRYGPVIPQLILEGVGKLDGGETAAARGLIVAMLGNTLSAEVAGMSATSTTVTIHKGTVPANEQVAKLRADAIATLEKLLDRATDDVAREEALAAIRKAGVPPIHGGSDELIVMAIEDVARIIAIEKARAAQWGLELRRKCEVGALRWYHRYGSLPRHLANNDAAVAAQQNLLAELQALRDTLSADPEFVLYRTLVGHDSVRPGAWDGRAFDSKATHQWRNGRFISIVEEITDDTVGGWIVRIRAYIDESKSGGGHLKPIADCLKLLGQTKPMIARAFLEVMDDALSPLLASLLLGIDEAGDCETTRHYVIRWLGEGRFLGLLGHYLCRQEPFDVDMLEMLVSRSIELADERGVLACLNAAAFHYERESNQRLIDKVFMPAISHLTNIEKYDWSRYAWSLPKGAMVAALSEPQVQRLLNSLVGVLDVDYETDMLLALIAERYPGLILDFFEARIQRERDDNGLRFDPIPFSLHTLREPLSAHPQLVIATARRWFEHGPARHQFRGGRLLYNVFPTLADIAAPLDDMVKQGNRDDLGFVIASLLAYEGAEQVYPLCMDIVDALEEGDALLNRVTHVLYQTGVLTGDDGNVEAEKARRTHLDRWRDDPRPKVRAYVRNLQRRVEQSMAWEQRRAEHDVEQRRRDWGEA